MMEQTYQPKTTEKKLTRNAHQRLEIARRLFKLFDKNNSGYLTEDEIPNLLEATYKDMGNYNFKATREDVKSYMRMVDANNDGMVSLE